MSGAASYRLHTYNAEDFPRLPDPRPLSRSCGRRGRGARDARQVSAVRPRATSRARCSPGSSFASRARTSSWPRRTRTAWPSRRRRWAPAGPELDAIVPARALGELSGSPRARGARDRCAREPGDLHDRRHPADDASDRGPVPELPPAAAGDLRARARSAARRAAGGRPPRVA